jgi:argininosuccinate lyase
MGAAPADALMAFTASLAFDKRLAANDVRGSIAHVHGLLRAGILTVTEDQVGAELAGDSFQYLETDEDIHTAIERRVTELAPESGTKLHTGRSRNDQVATALRLFTRAELARVIGHVLELQRTLERRATGAGDAYLPGYTHLQRAQPVLLAHHLLAHGWALSRDIDRMFATWRRLDV